MNGRNSKVPAPYLYTSTGSIVIHEYITCSRCFIFISIIKAWFYISAYILYTVFSIYTPRNNGCKLRNISTKTMYVVWCDIISIKNVNIHLKQTPFKIRVLIVCFYRIMVFTIEYLQGLISRYYLDKTHWQQNLTWAFNHLWVLNIVCFLKSSLE